jgi:DNA replication protein DnaC
MKNWFETIGDPTLADAILDRLIHNAHKINLKGESMRKIRLIHNAHKINLKGESMRKIRSSLTKKNKSEK